MISKKNQISIFVSFVLLVLIGLIIVFRSNSNLRKNSVNPKIGTIVESIYGLGIVTPDHIFHLRTSVALSVEDIFVREGDRINARKPLVQLDETVIKSPIDGTVTAIFAQKGELVTPSATIITVIDLDRLFLEVSLEQQSIMRVKKGQSAVVSFESLRNEKIDGRVTSVYPRENQFIVRVELDRWPEGILPGMTADVAILIDKRDQALLVPLKSIFSGQVIRYREGESKKISVKLGVVDEEWAEVLSDNIKPTDTLILRR